MGIEPQSLVQPGWEGGGAPKLRSQPASPSVSQLLGLQSPLVCGCMWVTGLMLPGWGTLSRP